MVRYVGRRVKLRSRPPARRLKSSDNQLAAFPRFRPITTKAHAVALCWDGTGRQSPKGKGLRREVQLPSRPFENQRLSEIIVAELDLSTPEHYYYARRWQAENDSKINLANLG